ncbi:hypothetical protein ACIPSE_13025 [Streptomyces sp. NPDC090106]|uniref:hypothetical protein n=1 Tax=Streptomyces sp. NPDC090106 TaxID=3365946 RepID=UPI0038107548
MNLREAARNSSDSGIGFVFGMVGLCGLALVAFAATQIGERVWAHLELRLWTVPGLAPALVLVGGALLIAGAYHGLLRRSPASSVGADR